ncbi:unnamed protein product [Amoebophrya sp. A120]|nr:unnamed protein product [Amoebophrya sp. A120]|eukprot:GSA120T00004282001.1
MLSRASLSWRNTTSRQKSLRCPVCREIGNPVEQGQAHSPGSPGDDREASEDEHYESSGDGRSRSPRRRNNPGDGRRRSALREGDAHTRSEEHYVEPAADPSLLREPLDPVLIKRLARLVCTINGSRGVGRPSSGYYKRLLPTWERVGLDGDALRVDCVAWRVEGERRADEEKQRDRDACLFRPHARFGNPDEGGLAPATSSSSSSSFREAVEKSRAANNELPRPLAVLEADPRRTREAHLLNEERQRKKREDEQKEILAERKRLLEEEKAARAQRAAQAKAAAAARMQGQKNQAQ